MSSKHRLTRSFRTLSAVLYIVSFSCVHPQRLQRRGLRRPCRWREGKMGKTRGARFLVVDFFFSLVVNGARILPLCILQAINSRRLARNPDLPYLFIIWTRAFLPFQLKPNRNLTYMKSLRCDPITMNVVVLRRIYVPGLTGSVEDHAAAEAATRP